MRMGSRPWSLDNRGINRISIKDLINCLKNIFGDSTILKIFKFNQLRKARVESAQYQGTTTLQAYDLEYLQLLHSLVSHSSDQIRRQHQGKMHYNTNLQPLSTRASQNTQQLGMKQALGGRHQHQPAPQPQHTVQTTELCLFTGGKPSIITIPRPQPPPSPRPRPRPGPIAPGPPPGNPTPPPTPRRPAHGRGGAGSTHGGHPKGPAGTTIPRPQPPPSPRPGPRRPGPIAPGPPPGNPTPPPTPRRPAAAGVVASPALGDGGLSAWTGGLTGVLRGVCWT